MDKRSCFVIMPFTSARFANIDLDERTLDYLWENVIKKALSEFKIQNKKAFSKIERYNSKVGSIIHGIVSNLNEADLVIADLTGLNSNVMYELGVRHTLRRGTIIITQDIASIPSDLRDYFCVSYKYSSNTIEQEQNFQQFKSDLNKAINELFSTDKYDSPILSYLRGKEKYWKEDRLETLRETDIILKYILEQFTMVRQTLNSTEIMETSRKINILSAHLANLASAISDLKVSPIDQDLYEGKLNAESLVTDILKSFYFSESYGGIQSMIPEEEVEARGMFESFKEGSLNKKHINYFSLKSGAYVENTIDEIFQDQHDLRLFISKLEEYVNRLSVELLKN